MVRVDEEEMLPEWLQGLMAETFFVACEIHYNHRKNEKNIYCLHCCQSFCTHCLHSHHPQHSLLQVRRYVYQDVIRLDDLEKIINCSFIQPYTINGAKVLFLNPRAQTQSRSNSKMHCGDANSRNTCFKCDRILQDPFNFCSISCKVDHYINGREEDLSRLLYNESDIGFKGLSVDEEETNTTSYILEDPIEYGGSSCGSENMEESKPIVNGIVLSFGSRRKGSPHRSPLS